MKKSREIILTVLSLAGLVIFFWSAIPIATGVMNVGNGTAMATGLLMAIYCLLSLKYPKETVPYIKDQDDEYRAKKAKAICKKENSKSGMRHTVLFGMRNVDLDEYNDSYEERNMAGLIFSRETRDKIDKVAIVIGVVILLFFGSMTGVLMSYDKYDGNPENKTVVVMGAKIEGDRPSMILEARLDKAFELMKDSDVKCILTGGQGKDEVFTEAYVMKNYLVEKGIPEDRIILEEKAENTYENLQFSKKAAEDNNLPGKFVIVTQGFHQHRASEYAESLGIESEGAKAYTSKGLWLGYWCRECIAVFANMTGLY